MSKRLTAEKARKVIEDAGLTWYDFLYYLKGIKSKDDVSKDVDIEDIRFFIKEQN